MATQAQALTLNNFYRYSDEQTLKLAKKVQETFRRLRQECYGVDELHVMKAVWAAYVELEDDARATYKRIVKHYSGEMDYYILDEIFGKPDPTTRYIWSDEVTRKRDRLFESILSYRAQTLPDGRKMDDNAEPFKTAMNLWARQIGQYAITVTDKAVIQNFKKSGVSKVRWVTERDDKVCEICAQLDNKIYNIDEIPDKPHYHCRCVVLPVY